VTTAKESGGEKETFAGRGREGIEIGRGNKKGSEGRKRTKGEGKKRDGQESGGSTSDWSTTSHSGAGG
jgi:hypothetical protein